MKMTSLVGLKATDITAFLAKDKAFIITSYREPIALVIPTAFASKREFYAAIEAIAGDLFNEQTDIS
jgi:hypothetical protein